jgi:hypothetical protein
MAQEASALPELWGMNWLDISQSFKYGSWYHRVTPRGPASCQTSGSVPILAPSGPSPGLAIKSYRNRPGCHSKTTCTSFGCSPNVPIAHLFHPRQGMTSGAPVFSCLCPDNPSEPPQNLSKSLFVLSPSGTPAQLLPSLHLPLFSTPTVPIYRAP